MPLPTQLVPYRFQARSGYLPLSQLDFDLDYVSGKVLSVKDQAFGATGDGLTDDGPAIARAIAAAQAIGAGTKLFFPRGTYLHSSPIVVTGVPIQLIGEGGASTAVNNIPASNCTVLRYTGGATATQVTFSLIGMSHGMRGFSLDSNLLCDTSLLVDSCIYGIYEDIACGNMKKWGVKLGTDAGGQTTSFNTVRNLHVSISAATAVAGIWLTGTPATNTCHNTFYDVVVEHAGAGNPNAIDIGNSDNNRFYNSFLFRGSGTGYGVNFITTENPPFPVNTFFFHTEAVGGVNMPVGCGAVAFYGYSQDNGEPNPSGAGSGNAYWDNAQHLNAPGYFAGGGGVGVMGGKGSTATAADASMTVLTPGSGIFVIRNLTTGGIALASVDLALPLVTSISDPSAIFAVADPGSGGNKFWGHVSAGSFVLTNRYGAAKDIAVALLTLYGTPG